MNLRIIRKDYIWSYEIWEDKIDLPTEELVGVLGTEEIKLVVVALPKVEMHEKGRMKLVILLKLHLSRLGFRSGPSKKGCKQEKKTA